MSPSSSKVRPGPVAALSSQRQLRALALLAVAAAGLWYVATHDPARAGNTPPCPALWLTGWQCPGCGSLRMIHSVLHGEWRRAWAYNAAAMLALPVAAWWALDLTALAAGVRGPPRLQVRAWMPRGLAVLLVVWWVGRNVRIWP